MIEQREPEPDISRQGRQEVLNRHRHNPDQAEQPVNSDAPCSVCLGCAHVPSRPPVNHEVLCHARIPLLLLYLDTYLNLQHSSK